MKLLTKLLLVLVFAIPPIHQVIWNSDMRIHLERCTSECNKKYCNISSICRPVNRTSKVKSLNIYLHPNVELAGKVEVITYKMFRTQYRQHMIRIKQELCPLLLYKNQSFFQLADEGLLQRIKAGVYGNFLEPCPLKGHRYLLPRTTNSDDDAYHLPLVPVGRWKLEVVLTKGAERILSFADYYEVKATGATEF